MSSDHWAWKGPWEIWSSIVCSEQLWGATRSLCVLLCVSSTCVCVLLMCPVTSSPFLRLGTLFLISTCHAVHAVRAVFNQVRILVMLWHFSFVFCIPHTSHFSLASQGHLVGFPLSMLQSLEKSSSFPRGAVSCLDFWLHSPLSGLPKARGENDVLLGVCSKDWKQLALSYFRWCWTCVLQEFL